MTKKTRTFAMVLLLSVTGGVAMAAPARPVPQPPDRTGGERRDVLAVLTDAEQKILALENAFPQSKFDWRPAPGIRSVAEVYLHIAFANYNLIRIAAGKAPPAETSFSLDRGKWDSQTTDKARIKTVVETSFAFAHDAIRSLSDADLERMVEFAGHPMTVRALLLTLVGHDNEHLGQAVAYARSNGVVPPWSQAKK